MLAPPVRRYMPLMLVLNDERYAVQTGSTPPWQADSSAVVLFKCSTQASVQDRAREPLAFEVFSLRRLLW